MAIHTVVLQDPTVLFLDHDRFMKILRRERLGVVVAVFGLGDVFGHEGVRQMAVDAASHSVVARLLPRIILRRHDMAVCAGFGVGAEIGQSFGIFKCERTGPYQQPKQYGQYRCLFIKTHFLPLNEHWTAKRSCPTAT